MQYRDKLDKLEARFEELNQQMADPAIISDGDQYRKITKARSAIEEIVNKYRDFKRADGELNQAKGMLEDTDPDMRDLARLEVDRLRSGPVRGRDDPLRD